MKGRLNADIRIRDRENRVLLQLIVHSSGVMPGLGFVVGMLGRGSLAHHVSRGLTPISCYWDV
jgi:hypothetical protein